MDQNVKHIFIGEGRESTDIYTTVDFNPIIITIKYNLIEHSVRNPWVNINSDRAYYSQFEVPNFIDRLFTLKNYQIVLDIVCDALGIERRDLLIKKDLIYDTFNFRKSEFVFEYHFCGPFGNTYYSRSHYRNALKFNEFFELRTRVDDYRFSDHLQKVYEALCYQKVLHQRKDYYKISNETVDKFLNKLINL